MRVLHLIKSLGRGGAEMLLPMGLAAADRQRFEYEYGYFLPWKDAVVPDLREQAAEVTCFEARSNMAILAAARRVARYLRDRNVDIVHAHLPLAGVVARIAGRLARVPVIYTEHNLQERYHPLTRWLNRGTWGWQAEVIAVSGDVAESSRRLSGHRIPVRTIFNGVDVRAFDPLVYDGAAVRDRYGIPRDAPVAGTIAVFRVQKRLGDWLRVARRAAAEVPGIHFLLVGDGPERANVEAQVASFELEDIVHLTGLQPEVRPYLAAMDVYLMTSKFEGLPIALLEAMAMGVPPVVTAVGGVPEVIQDGESGKLQPFGFIDRLAADVGALAVDEMSRRRMGQAARETVVERFSIARMQRELEEIYGRIVTQA